jgi:hypothetical protein
MESTMTNVPIIRALSRIAATLPTSIAAMPVTPSAAD